VVVVAVVVMGFLIAQPDSRGGFIGFGFANERRHFHGLGKGRDYTADNPGENRRKNDRAKQERYSVAGECNGVATVVGCVVQYISTREPDAIENKGTQQYGCQCGPRLGNPIMDLRARL
jgi:hypothetical protein